MTKKEQLKKIFTITLMKMLEETKDMLCPDDRGLACVFANTLLKEVTIRTNL